MLLIAVAIVGLIVWSAAVLFELSLASIIATTVVLAIIAAGIITLGEATRKAGIRTNAQILVKHAIALGGNAKAGIIYCKNGSLKIGDAKFWKNITPADALVWTPELNDLLVGYVLQGNKYQIYIIKISGTKDNKEYEIIDQTEMDKDTAVSIPEPP